MIVLESSLLGLASTVIGVAMGYALSWILIYVINRVSFGWTIQLQISPGILATSSLLVLATSFVAAIGPANAAASKKIAEVVRAE